MTRQIGVAQGLAIVSYLALSSSPLLALYLDEKVFSEFALRGYFTFFWGILIVIGSLVGVAAVVLKNETVESASMSLFGVSLLVYGVASVAGQSVTSLEGLTPGSLLVLGASPLFFSRAIKLRVEGREKAEFDRTLDLERRGGVPR